MIPNIEGITEHAYQRAQQRGIAGGVVDLLMRFGKQFPAGDGCVRIQLDRRGTRRAARFVGSEGRQLVDRARGIALVLAGDGHTVTVQHITSRCFEKHRPWRARPVERIEASSLRAVQWL